MSADFTSYANVTINSSSSPLAITTTEVCDGPARLFGVYINTALSAHAVYLRDYDDSVSPIRDTLVLTIPASAAAGTMYTFPGLQFKASLRVVSSNAAATGAVTVAYKSGSPGSLGVSAP